LVLNLAVNCCGIRVPVSPQQSCCERISLQGSDQPPGHEHGRVPDHVTDDWLRVTGKMEVVSMSLRVTQG
jgi:hypothetical protein